MTDPTMLGLLEQIVEQLKLLNAKIEQLIKAK